MFIKNEDFDGASPKRGRSWNDLTSTSGHYNWGFPHFITQALHAVTSDIAGDGKTAAGIHPLLKTMTVQGFGDQAGTRSQPLATYMSCR